MMVPSRGGGIQQVRAVPRGTLRRNIASGYQSTRMPSINLIMSGGSGARNNETIGGSGTTRQLPPPGSQLMSGGGVAHSRQILSNAPSSSQGPISRQLAAITAQNPAAVSSSSSTGLSSSPSSSQSTNITTSYVRTIPASPTIVSQGERLLH
ncbi:unnamed protein product [Anisakis simplex]|uniref:SLAIN motif-containing protein 2 n=1 Tax=Anisakis simplex TaxID=6269 RepID=A0A0M3J9R3_ANISI|nr:unnamed protein product [Anisakis simplex]